MIEKKLINLREWKARADDPSQEECISHHPDDFGKFKIFLATVGLVEELR